MCQEHPILEQRNLKINQALVGAVAAISATATIIEVEDVDGEVVEAVDMVEAMDMEVVAGEEVVEEEVGEAM